MQRTEPIRQEPESPAEVAPNRYQQAIGRAMYIKAQKQAHHDFKGLHPRTRKTIRRGHGTSLAKRAPKAAPHWSKQVAAWPDSVAGCRYQVMRDGYPVVVAPGPKGARLFDRRDVALLLAQLDADRRSA